MELKRENDKTAICRLCLKAYDNGIETVIASVQELLDFLLLNPDLGISGDPAICESCVASLKKCSGFKKSLLNAKNRTSFVLKYEDETNVKLELPLKCFSDETNVDTTNSVSFCKDSCCFCMETVECKLKFFNNDCIDMRVILGKHFPELDRNICQESVICAPCYGSLQYCFAFLSSCSNTEEKIKQYCKSAGVSSQGHVELDGVLNFLANDTTKSEYDHSILNVIKVKEEYDEELKNEIVEIGVKDEVLIKAEEDALAIKDEDTGVNAEQSDCYRYQDDVPDVPLVQQPNAKPTKELAATIYKCKLCRFETNNEFKDVINKHIMFHHPSSHNQSTYKCNVCMLANQSASDVTIYQCKMCEYHTRYEVNLQTHKLTHRSRSKLAPYQCDICAYTTKQGSAFQMHMLAHKRTYKCTSCAYQTTHEDNFEKHMLIHTALSNCKCEVCGQESKSRDDLEIHMLIHKTPAEILTETTYKSSLKTHMLTHNNAGDLHKCNLCPFEVEGQEALLKHSLAYSGTQKYVVHKCEMCEFQTKHKSNRYTDMLRYKGAVEVPMYKCTICSYETEYKGVLKAHFMLLHKSSPALTVYRCRKLRTSKAQLSHVRVNATAPDDLMYKCGACKYRCKYKRYLHKHMLRHKDPSEVTMYDCQVCEYRSKYKCTLKKHMLTHNKMKV